MAIRVEQITTLEQINKIIWDQQYQSTLMRNRSPYLYRGLPNSNYHLVTSLRRNCKEKKNDIELAILRNFVKYAALEDPALKTSIWRQMIVGQHHGLPSRLLDWTYSVLIALHFATSGENLDDMSKNAAVLWQIDILEMNKRLPKNYQTTLKNESAFLMTVDMMDSLTRGGNTYDILNRYDSDMGTASMVFLEPPSIDQRIIGQYSYFSIIPSRIENLQDDTGIETFLDETQNTVKYIISTDLKWRIRDMLDQMNINERILFPGLDGITSWMKRHYYVRSGEQQLSLIHI